MILLGKFYRLLNFVYCNWEIRKLKKKIVLFEFKWEFRKYLKWFTYIILFWL